MKELMEIRVANSSDASKVAGMIAACVNEGKRVELHAVGVASVNQSVKAIAIARGYLAPSGVNLSCIPAFTTVKFDDEERSAIKFILVVGE